MKISLKTLVARVVVFLMFGMLILSFAIWGIGDIFRRGISTQAVAQVGSVRIMPMEFQEQYRRELRRLQGIAQSEITVERARELGIPQRVLRDMVARALLDLASRDAGVAVSDAVVRQAIFDNPAFRNAEGKFDRNVFENLLMNAGFTEDRFVVLTRQDIVRNQLVSAVTAGGMVPHLLLDDLYRYREERRTADTVQLTAAAVKEVPAPSEDEIAAYRKDHAKAFTAPEYRAITAVLLRPDDVAARMTVDDDKLKDEYEARVAEFKVPEERDLRQIILKDEAAAKEASERLTQGQSLDKVAEDLTGKPPIELGTVKQDDVAAPALAAAAFALKEGEVTAPVETPLGWHIAQVVKILPGRTQSFEEAKPRLVHELQLREAGDAVYDLGNKLQDTLGGGATLEEAAQKLSLKLVKIAAVDAGGLAPGGKRPEDLPASQKFLPTAFAAEPGRASELTEDGQGGYFILRVDKVTPSALRPLAEVRDKAVAEWQAEARRKAAGKLAADFVEKVKGGGDFAALAKEDGYIVTQTQPMTRTGEGAGAELPPELVAQLFAAKPGDVMSAATPDGAVIAKLATVIPADPDKDAAGVKSIDEQLTGTMDADLLNAFVNALRARYGVEVNESVLDASLGS